MILVVDDDAAVRATIRHALEELGYPVEEAANGLDALAMLESGAPAPSLVILDYRMPGMDGAETARRIAELDADMPIIFSTGHSALRALRAAAGDSVAVLEKPFTLNDLGALIADKLAERRR